MKKILKTALCAILISSSAILSAQNSKLEVELTEGKVVYALPRTTLSFKIGVEVSKYTPGPYAMYAKKYLGIAAESSPYTSYNILSVSVTPYVEADPAHRFAIVLSSPSKVGNMLRLTNQGLVAMSDDFSGRSAGWRFASSRQENVSSSISSNLTEKTSSLYKTVETAGGVEWVPVKQSQVVQKSLESKAKETADIIFMLKEKRLDIITGNTDAVFDGEAMKATLDEIKRLEDSYMAMFLGTNEYDVVYSYVDVVPTPESEMMVAFRFSEDMGVVSTDDVLGRPITMDIQCEELQEAQNAGRSKEIGVFSSKVVYYRVPTVAKIVLADSDEVLLETRLPIYQLGKTVSIPL